MCLPGRHAQMTHFGVYPLVCPYSLWPGQGFYVELFLYVPSPLSRSRKGEGHSKQNKEYLRLYNVCSVKFVKRQL